jgi:hypothetical protein
MVTIGGMPTTIFMPGPGALQVIAINVLSFAEHAQAQLVEYIRNDLNQPRMAEWYQAWWTGARGW